MGNVLITSSSLPSDYCWTGPQQYLQDFVPLLSGNFIRAGTGINYGNDLPLAENEDKPWLRANPDGTPDRIYHFGNGLWLARNPIPPGAVWMFEGTEIAGIQEFDGGELLSVSPVGLFTGPMWEKVSQMDARSPMGPGTLPSGHVLNIGDDYGAEEFSLTALNLPEHFHDIIGNATGTIGAGDGGWVIGTGSTASGAPARDLAEGHANRRTGRTEDAGEIAADIDPISNVHPVHAIWFIRRTARLYYRYP